MNTAAVPTTSPVQVAPETFLIPNLADGGDGVYVPVNSLLIRGPSRSWSTPAPRSTASSGSTRCTA